MYKGQLHIKAPLHLLKTSSKKSFATWNRNYLSFNLTDCLQIYFIWSIWLFSPHDAKIQFLYDILVIKFWPKSAQETI